jgi:exonuclease VII large subunit
MTEPTIICPNCKTEIKLTESLAAPLIESTRKQIEQQLAQKDSDIASREQAIREKEKQLADAKIKLDEQVANQVEEQLKKDRVRIAAEESKKAKFEEIAPIEFNS